MPPSNPELTLQNTGSDPTLSRSGTHPTFSPRRPYKMIFRQNFWRQDVAKLPPPILDGTVLHRTDSSVAGPLIREFHRPLQFSARSIQRWAGHRVPRNSAHKHATLTHPTTILKRLLRRGGLSSRATRPTLGKEASVRAESLAIYSREKSNGT